MRLVVEQGKLAGHGFDLARPVITIGRGRDCDIILDEHQVSRQHARLQQTPEGWMLLDLGSTNGTRVNGLSLTPHEPYALQQGDRISLGACLLAMEPPAIAPPPVEPHRSGRDGRPRPALLIAEALLMTAVLVVVAVGLVLLLQDNREETAPASTSPLDSIDDVLEIPTLIEGITTAKPIPTQLEELATEMPIPTDLEEMATSLPVSTQIQELVTALPEPLEFPALPPVTPPPLHAAAPSANHGAGE